LFEACTVNVVPDAMELDVDAVHTCWLCDVIVGDAEHDHVRPAGAVTLTELVVSAHDEASTMREPAGIVTVDVHEMMLLFVEDVALQKKA
jgi:hypothetical protein